MASQPTCCVRRGSRWKRHFLKHLPRVHLSTCAAQRNRRNSLPAFLPLAQRGCGHGAFVTVPCAQRGRGSSFPLALSRRPATDGERAAPNPVWAAPLPRMALHCSGEDFWRRDESRPHRQEGGMPAAASKASSASTESDEGASRDGLIWAHNPGRTGPQQLLRIAEAAPLGGS